MPHLRLRLIIALLFLLLAPKKVLHRILRLFTLINLM
jgi:hypothetical protein